MGLRDVLKKHNVPLPPDFDQRFEIIKMGLRRDPKFKSELNKYSRQKGGEEDPEPPALEVKQSEKGEDFLGPRVRWVKDALTSPYARTMLGGVFMVVFFLSYLEKLPVFGSIVSATLDLMLMGGKMLTKTVQSALPPMIGLVPLPYASMAGIGVAAVFGLIMWPIFAIVSLSRQDFATATESFIRIVPPPFGDMLANTFTEGNRTVARLDEKRIKLGSDISEALTKLSELATSVSASMKEGLQSLAEQTTAAASAASSKMESSVPTLPDASSLPKLPEMSALEKLRTQKTDFAAPSQLKGGFHRRTKRKEWRHRRTQRRSARR
jgi:hypothetical protein